MIPDISLRLDGMRNMTSCLYVLMYVHDEINLESELEEHGRPTPVTFCFAPKAHDEAPNHLSRAVYRNAKGYHRRESKQSVPPTSDAYSICLALDLCTTPSASYKCPVLLNTVPKPLCTSAWNPSNGTLSPSILIYPPF